MTTVSVVVESTDPHRTHVALQAFERDGCVAQIILVNRSADPRPVSGSRVGPPVCELQPSARSQAAALNAGAAAAVGDLILFLGDRVVPFAGIPAAHARANGAGKAVVVGRVEPRLVSGADALARAFAAFRRERQDELAARPDAIGLSDCTLDHLSVDREAFLRVGGLREDLGAAASRVLVADLLQDGSRLLYLDVAGVTLDVAAGRDVARWARDAAYADLAAYRERSSLLSRLRPAQFIEQPLRWRLGRRALLGEPLRRPSARLATLGARLQPRLAQLALDLAYWGAVREGLDRDAWRSLVRGAAVLMYHAVGGPRDMPSRFVIPVRRLERQLAWLRRRGYRVVSLGQLLRWRRAGTLPPPKTVVLTFDDGYLDNLQFASTVLERANVEATLFVVTGEVGHSMSWGSEPELVGRPLLSWEQIRQLRDRGAFAVGAHSRHHPVLTDVGADEARDEIEGSVADLKAHGYQPDMFAYPGGRHDASVRSLVAAAGIPAALTVEPGAVGPATDDLRLPRHEIWGTDSLLSFALLVAVGYTPRRRRSG